MRLFNNIQYAILLLTFGFISCTKVVDVEVPDAGSRLVIEASIDWEKGTSGANQVISLSTSTPYFSENKNVPVIGALVTVIKENDSTRMVFTDRGDGNYVTEEFVAEENVSYTLEIEYNNQVYRARETMTPLDAEIIEIEQTTENGFSLDDIEVTMHYNDPGNQSNYYMGQFFPSHKPVPTVWAFDDQFSNGNESMFFYEDEDFEPGVEVDITLLGISEKYYHYISLVISQSSQGAGGPFQTTPVHAIGNCLNISNPDQEALGYFRLCQVEKTSHTIQ